MKATDSRKWPVRVSSHLLDQDVGRPDHEDVETSHASVYDEPSCQAILRRLAEQDHAACELYHIVAEHDGQQDDDPLKVAKTCASDQTQGHLKLDQLECLTH